MERRESISDEIKKIRNMKRYLSVVSLLVFLFNVTNVYSYEEDDKSYAKEFIVDYDNGTAVKIKGSEITCGVNKTMIAYDESSTITITRGEYSGYFHGKTRGVDHAIQRYEADEHLQVCVENTWYELTTLSPSIDEPIDAIEGKKVTFSARTCELSFGKIIELFRDKGPETMIQFRFMIDLCATRSSTLDNLCGKIVTSYSEMVHVIKCDGGKIRPNESVNPILDDNYTGKVYAVYPTASSGALDAIDVESVEDAYKYSVSSQRFFWKITDANSGNLVKSESGVEDGYKFSYGGASVVEGKEYSIVRGTEIVNKGEKLSCESTPIGLQVVKPALLDGFTTTEYSVCPSKIAVKFSAEDDYTDDTKWLWLKGNTLNVESEPYAKVYGIKYKWEYKSVNSAKWTQFPEMENGISEGKTMQYNTESGFSGLYEKRPQDLVTGLDLFQNGETYLFRQVAYLQGFQNREIRASEGGVLSVSVYDTISPAMFRIDHMGMACADGASQEVRLNATFLPRSGASYKYVDDYQVEKLLKYEWNFPLAEMSGSDLSQNLDKACSVASSSIQTAYVDINVTDGCGVRINLRDSLTFRDVPFLDPNRIVCSHASYSYIPEDKVVEALVPEGEVSYLSVSSEDVDYSTSDYYCSFDQGTTYHKISSRGEKIDLGQNSELEVYVKKQNKNGTVCSSSPVVVVYKKIGAITNNVLESENLYVCLGSSNPEIKGPNASGGYWDIYTYKWLYSADDVIYSVMKTDSSIIEDVVVPKGGWNVKIDKPYYVKRIAISKKGGAMVSDTSPAVRIVPFSTPTLTLTTDRTKVCYDSLANLSVKQDDKSLNEVLLMKGLDSTLCVDYSFAYKNDTGTFVKFNDKPLANHEEVYGLRIDRDTVAYALLEVCGKTYVSEGVSISSGEDLKPIVKFDDCIIRGASMKVNVTYPSSAVNRYVWIDGKAVGENFDDIYEVTVPEVGSTQIKVRTETSKYECAYENTYSLDEELIHSPFKRNPLKASQESEDVVSVCAGRYITFASDSSVNPSATNYIWTVNDFVQEDNNSLSLDYKFSSAGATYRVARETREVNNGTLCQSVIDTIMVNTYDKISGSTLTMESEYVCDGYSLHCTLSGMSGGSYSNYKSQFFDGVDSLGQYESTAGYDFSNDFSLTEVGEHDIYAVVYDMKCEDMTLYSQRIPVRKVYQAESAAFELAASPKMVTESVNSTDVVITALAKDGGDDADVYEYSYSNAMGKIVSGKKIGSPFLVVVDPSSFIDNKMTMTVTRTNGKTGCTAHNKVTISQCEGFLDRPSIVTSGIGTNEGNLVCGGTEVTFSIPLLPKFGEDYLDSSLVSYSWYKNGALASYDPKYTVTAIAGDTVRVMCKISYQYDASAKAAYVYSDEFKLIGKRGVVIGNILGPGNNNRYHNICLGDDNVQVELDAYVSNKGDKDSLQWQQSSDAVNWEVVPKDNIAAGGKSGTIVLDGKYYNREAKTTYFRLMGISECGTKTYSGNNFALRVDTLPEPPVVELVSGNVMEGNKLDILDFKPVSNYAEFEYLWGSQEGKVTAYSWEGGTAGVKGDYVVGKNSIYVSKRAETGAMCYSKVKKFDFNVYAKLHLGSLSGDLMDSSRCSADHEVNLLVPFISGGTGEYGIDWQYSIDSVTWVSFNENNIKLPFTSRLSGYPAGKNYQFDCNIEGLHETTSFRAVVYSKGDYTGPSVMTNVYTADFYGPLTGGGIDNAEVVQCAGVKIPSIKGVPLSGGDGNYSYQWMKTTTPEVDSSWMYVSGAATENYTVCDTLYTTTYYKRVAKDGCGTTIESRKKMFNVLPVISILPEEVGYNSMVNSGKYGKMWGVSYWETSDRIVWYDDKKTVMDTTAMSIVYITKNSLSAGEKSTVYTFYAKKLEASNGCLSTNFDTIHITAVSKFGGEIFVEGTTEKNADGFWVCPNDNNVEIKSGADAENAEIEWFYRVVKNVGTSDEQLGNWTTLRSSNGSVPVHSQSVSLDTCVTGEMFGNRTGRKMYVEIKRVAFFHVGEEDFETESNVVRINVVPTMQSVQSLYDVVGTLSTDKKIYCKGEEAVVVNGEVDPLDETYTVWNNPTAYFGPWLYDNQYGADDGFATWFEFKTPGTEYDTSEIKYYGNNGYVSSFLPGEGSRHELNSNYTVRRAVSDGCTSAYTDPLTLMVRDEVGLSKNIEMYAMAEDGRTRFYSGFEMGDSLLVGYISSDAYDCMWSLDSLFSDTLEAVKSYCTFRLSDSVYEKLMKKPTVYLRRKSDGCWSSALAVPIPFGKTSDGGLIGSDQIICQKEKFDAIGNVLLASGEYLTPTSAEMKWTYSWQFCSDSVTWINVEGADSSILQPVYVNKCVNMLEKPVTYFRRVGVNDSGRKRYSNVVKLKYYDDFVPGVLSLNSVKNTFCADEKLPVINTTPATGARTDDYGVDYSWYIQLNGGDFFKLPDFKGLSLNMMLVDTITHMARKKNAQIRVKCVYADGQYGCGSVESEPISFVLYRENLQPDIYQTSDECDADLVVVKVVKDGIDKTYNFIGVDDSVDQSSYVIDTSAWTRRVDSIELYRRSDMHVSDYGVYSVDDETGCYSNVTFFNVDSLPPLSQKSFEAPNVVCYGESFTVSAGPATGGNGEKSYAWQYSYDGIAWNVLLNRYERDLVIEQPTKSTYYRRVVLDNCFADTSDAIFVKVREKVPFDIYLDVQDFKCEGQDFNISLSEEMNPIDNVNYYVMEVFDVENEVYVKYDNFRGETLKGFLGETLPLMFYHVIVEDGKSCESDHASYLAHNAIALDHERNVISCTNINPCNGLVVAIDGTLQDRDFADHFSYKWYVSRDNLSWTEQAITEASSFPLKVKDTMFVRRIVSNGCQYDTSNVLTIYGKETSDYDYVANLDLKVVSDVSDSSVTLFVTDGKNFSERYYFVGDGQLPVVQYNENRLPYNMVEYKDSVLQLVALDDNCVAPYDVKPLRGGIISFDGGSLLCEGDSIPAIVSTDVEGGYGEYSYQWQYKNEYTGNFINIDGATDKVYIPKPAHVATEYKRITFDHEYELYSNSILVKIRPLPKSYDVTLNVSDSVWTSMGLKRSSNRVEKLPSMTIVLVDTISDADEVVWQKSFDKSVWEDVESYDANDMGVYTHEVSDTSGVIYFRTIATNSCGADTSRIFSVVSLYGSYILDSELVLTDTICKGDPYARIAFVSDFVDKYEYSYRTIGYQGGAIYSAPSTLSDPSAVSSYASAGMVRLTNDTVKTVYGAVFFAPKCSFDVEITRYVKETGASSTKMVHFFVDELSAKFSYVVDGRNHYESGGRQNSVKINQGSLVSFIPDVMESSLPGLELTYKWYLLEPLHPDYFDRYAAYEGKEGLTSNLQTPECYFYNPLNYSVKLEVSDGFCSASEIDRSMYIDKSTFRSLEIYSHFVDPQEIQSFDFDVLGRVGVYPNPCGDWLYIVCDDDTNYGLFDLDGKELLSGVSVQSPIDMRPFAPGSYLLRIGEENIIVLKK